MSRLDLSEISTASKAEMAAGVGTKDDFEKVRLDLLPTEALESVARVLEAGARKYYSEFNWRNGMPWRRPAAAALRHIFQWLRGEDIDDGPGGTGQPHIACAICMLLFLLTYILTKTGSDNRYRTTPEVQRA